MRKFRVYACTTSYYEFNIESDALDEVNKASLEWWQNQQPFYEVLTSRSILELKQQTESE